MGKRRVFPPQAQGVGWVERSETLLGELSMLGERKFLPTVSRLAVILALLLVASLVWASYRNHASSADPAKAVTAGWSSTLASMSQEIAHIGSSGSEGLSNTQSAIMFSIAPLTSLSAMTTPAGPDPVTSVRNLPAVPPDTAREALHIDPRRMRTMVDRGVVEYASAKTNGERARGAGLIQTAALLGYPPARDLLARSYPQSEAVRSVVPAKDVIRYALGPVMDAAATGEESKQIFLALGQHFASRRGGSVRRPDPHFSPRRLASAARLPDRHLAGLAGARARSLRRACRADTGGGRGCRPRMFFQPKSAQAHRNDSAGP
jgi:hypothetical protein